MTRKDYIYTSLCTLFSILIVVSNLIYQKFVSLHVLPFQTFELSVGAILYPLTFLITDLIAEFYGKKEANFCVRLAISINIIVACVVAGMDRFEPTSWSKIDKNTFHQVFGFYSVAFIGSTIACYIAQFIDIIVYLNIRRITKGKWLWLRNNGSTCISLFVDTFIVIICMSLFKLIPFNRVWSLIIDSYLFKLFFSFSSTPIFYLFVAIMRKVWKEEKLSC